jgi:hypothetical protein
MSSQRVRRRLLVFDLNGTLIDRLGRKDAVRRSRYFGLSEPVPVDFHASSRRIFLRPL